MRIERFEDIEAWQLARELTRKVYSLTKKPQFASELYVAMDQQYITDAEFQDVYDHAGRTRAAIRGFIKYLVSYKKGQRKKGNLEP